MKNHLNKKKLFIFTSLSLLFAVGFVWNIFTTKSGYCSHLSKNPDLLKEFTQTTYIPDLNDYKHVKQTPESFKYIPFLLYNLASAIPPHVYAPKDMYQDLMGPNPELNSIAIMMHEKVHLDRWTGKRGVPLIKYVFSKKYRIQEELYAIASEMRYRKSVGLDYDFDRKARHFATSVYMWACEYDDMYRVLETLWEETPS